MKSTGLKLLLSTVLLSSVAFSQTLEIIYEKRPPYVMKENNTLTGILGIPLIHSLKKSNISYTIVEKPSKRHLHEIKVNKKPLCAVGWFKNVEREKFAKYTNPLYQDKPMGIVTRVNHPKIMKNITIDQLLSKKELIILGKKSYSYGKYIDEKINQYSSKKRDVSSDNITMLKLVAKKRADFMFISNEEANNLLKNSEYKQSLEFISLNDMPQGNKRYLICSKVTSDAIIALINSNL